MFDENKGRMIGGLFGPVGSLAGMAYDKFNSYVNRPKTNISRGPVEGPIKPTVPAKATYTSRKARTNYNNAVSDLNAYKARQNETKSTVDSFANPFLMGDKKDSKDDDGEKSPLEKYLKEVQNIQAGKFKYSSTEKKNLENLRATGRQAELRQSRVNENYMGGTLQGELRSGRSRYAQEIADDAMINAMQYGVDQINELDLETQKGIVELEQAIKEERLRQVAEKYGFLQKQDQQREEATQNLQKNILEYQKLLAQVQNQSRGSSENDYNLALSQGYNGTYVDFLRQMESNKLAGKYAPVGRSSKSSTSGSSVASALTAFLNS